jgi:hypothetical protein
MSSQTPGDKTPVSDQILDLLWEALLERQAKRAQTARPAQLPAAQPQPDAQPAAQPAPRPVAPPTAERPAAPAKKPLPMRREPRPGDAGWELPPRQPSINMGKMLGRLLIVVAFLVVLVNIPVNRYGVGLARIMPDSASLIIRDGLILKGSGPEIYKLEDNRLRWISSLDAFDHLGLTWDDVHAVDDAFLRQFEKGAPIHVLLKCEDSPHIYRLENQKKRWIKDINTFLAEGHVWDDVRFVPCEYLRSIPDGPPIPENAGTPPQP